VLLGPEGVGKIRGNHCAFQDHLQSQQANDVNPRIVALVDTLGEFGVMNLLPDRSRD
jgi:hypothetical protein